MSESFDAVIVGAGIFALCLLGAVGPDLLGWVVVTTSVWTSPDQALAA